MSAELHSEPRRNVPRSVPPQVSSFDACVRLLSWIEAVPNNATGALTFDDGLILVEKQRVCWAIAASMGVYLTELLCEFEQPSLDRGQIEQIYRRCKRSGLRLSEALLSSGLISETRLRGALREHNSEAIVRLSHASAPPQFRKLIRGGYDDRFLVSTAELLATIGARSAEPRAVAAGKELELTAIEGATGVAFVREAAFLPPTVVAVANHCALPVEQLVRVCAWAADFFALSASVDARTSFASAMSGDNGTLVTWQRDDVGYVALCAHRVASARVIDRLSRANQAPSGDSAQGSNA